MQTVSIEPSVNPVENYTNNFFVKLPVDTTRNRVQIEKILPSTTLKGNTTIVFNFPYKV